MRIGILTSSRADYGYYRPLLKAIQSDNEFEMSIIAFGTHLLDSYGKTINDILKDGFEVKYQIDCLESGDSPAIVASSYANTTKLFTEFWAKHQTDFDWVLCLGDRFEMAAAVNSSIPFQLKFAHLYAGETTLGAIDEIYRHQISLVCKKHFVNLPAYKERVQNIIGNEGDIEVIGNTSLHNLNDLELLTIPAFQEKWNIDLSQKTILVTFHPETVHFENAANNAGTVSEVLSHLVNDYQIVITMPNADTNSSVYRKMFNELADKYPSNVFLIENFGTQSYFSCMQHATFLLGNTSSGIVEAASFKKYVINVGDRQKGRFIPDNILNVPFENESILNAVRTIADNQYEGENPFYIKNSMELILNSLKRG